MGGFGSGRHRYAATPDVEACRRLDSDEFSEFVEKPSGSCADITWGDETSIRGCVVNSDGEGPADGLRVEHTDAVDGAADPPDEYVIPFDYTEPHFGGVRPWFRCPRCHTRRGKLYLPPGGEVLACRECYGLQYRSSRDSGNEMERALQRYRKAFARADKDDRRPHPEDVFPTSPEKPKGMHQETFDELLADVREARGDWYDEFNRRLGQYQG